MSYEVEKDWETKSGLRAVAILITGRHRCGYVGVPKDHPLFGFEYHDHCPALADAFEKAKQGPLGKRGLISVICSDGEKASMDIVFDVHGGVTYTGESDNYPVESDLWWIGFDCAHAGDGSLDSRLSFSDGPVRSLDYVVSECESLANQIKEIFA